MSFRTRLILSFALVVLVPVLAVSLGLVRLADDVRSSETDSALESDAETALTVFGDELAAATGAARTAARDEALAAALLARDAGAVRASLRRLARELDLAALSVRLPSGRTIAHVGERAVTGVGEVAISKPGEQVGTVLAATLTPARFVARVSRLTGAEVALLRGERAIESTLDLGDADLARSSEPADLSLPSGEARILTARPAGAGPAGIALIEPRATSGVGPSVPLLVAGALGFVALALLFVVLLVRALQGQVRQMLTAAHRIGGGDFSQRVPVEGNDELAGLAREFNTMSERLGRQLGELGNQHAELERFVKRIGEAFVAGLDRRALAHVAAETAVAACRAEAARTTLTGLGEMQEPHGDRLPGDLDAALREAEAHALRDGTVAEAECGDAFAVAQPLPLSGSRWRGSTIAIARRSTPFDVSQRRMLRYLAGQAGMALDNIDLHEATAAGNVIDEATGLQDARRIREVLTEEVERAQRFGRDLSLLLIRLDLATIRKRLGDDPADGVLRDAARVLDDSARTAARTGRWADDDLAVVLPDASLDETLELAKRVRAGISSAPAPSHPDAPSVDMSAGIAALPRFGGTAEELASRAAAALEDAPAGGIRAAAGAHVDQTSRGLVGG